MRRTHYPWCGFTQVELMVVLALVAVLLALMFPYLSRSRHQANQVLCASNLRQVYVASELWRQDHARAPLPAEGWRSSLWPYLEAASSVYFCPETGVRDRGISLSQVAVRTGQSVVYLEPGPNVIQSSVGGQNFQLTLAAPAPDAGELVVRVDDHGSSISLTPLRKTGGGSFDLINVLSQEVIQPGVGESAAIGKTITLGEPLVSYGVNAQWNDVRRTGHKVYALDFASTVADPDDAWSQYATPKGEMTFARHLGKVNVLFSDGSVHAMPPADVNPGHSAHANLWRP